MANGGSGYKGINGQFVDSTTTKSMTSHAGFATQNNGISRAGSCEDVGGPGTSSSVPNRDLFSLQEELLNGTFNH